MLSQCQRAPFSLLRGASPPSAAGLPASRGRSDNEGRGLRRWRRPGLAVTQPVFITAPRLLFGQRGLALLPSFPWRPRLPRARTMCSAATAPRWSRATRVPTWPTTSARGRSSAPGGSSGSTWLRGRRYGAWGVRRGPGVRSSAGPFAEAAQGSAVAAPQPLKLVVRVQIPVSTQLVRQRMSGNAGSFPPVAVTRK